MAQHQHFQKRISLTIPFSSHKQANTVYDILNVDKELKGSQVKREITVNDDELIINFEGTDIKRLRVAPCKLQIK